MQDALKRLNRKEKTDGPHSREAEAPDQLLVTAQPKTLVCEAEPDGKPCGAEAKVRRVHYRYTAKLDRRLGEVQQVLSEAIYEIACPRCGWRTQVQKVERN